MLRLNRHQIDREKQAERRAKPVAGGARVHLAQGERKGPALDGATGPFPVVTSPAGDLVLRDERPDDAEFRFRLFRLSRGPQWEALAQAPGFEPLLRQQFSAQSASYGACASLIVERAGAPVGRLALKCDDSLWLMEIALLPDARGQGVGATLLVLLQAEARKRALPLRLSVARDNPRAAALYRRLGFTDCGGDAVYAKMIWTAG